MGFKDKIKEIEDKLDLSKKYPNYINRPVFRIGLFVFLIFVFSIILVYGFNTKWVNIVCESSTGYCENPYLECKADKYSKYCLMTNNLPCIGRNCENERISFNDYIGEKAPPVIENANIIMLFILVSTFLINHLIYIKNIKKYKVKI